MIKRFTTSSGLQHRCMEVRIFTFHEQLSVHDARTYRRCRHGKIEIVRSDCIVLL